MKFFSRRGYFEKDFKLNDNFVYKSCIGFNYSNIYKDEFVVQGFCISKDYCMITAYSKYKSYSRVYLYEKNGQFCKYVELDNSAHVGGITYDYVNNIVYITGSRGRIYAYDYNELISGNIMKYDCYLDVTKVLDNSARASTVYFYDNFLYVCSFSNVGRMVKFNVIADQKNRKVIVNDYFIFNNLPACIQGVCVFEYNKEFYYLFSQSFGRLKSIIKLYDNKLNFLSQKVLKEIGLEGIDIDYLGNVVCIFENGIDSLRKVHLCDIVEKFNKLLENKVNKKGMFHQIKIDKMQ